MSKHAVEAFTDSLTLEMAPLGVAVSTVEPGNSDSEIGASADKRAGAKSRLANRPQFKKPDEVSAAVKLALFEPSPKRRHMGVPNERNWILDKQIDRRTLMQWVPKTSDGNK
jgi:NAD(P)-dependent dehydrogenase (short-subunit alcohol dehydrogenase family)